MNEKITKLTHEISLMLFSVIIGGILLAILMFTENESAKEILSQIKVINLEQFLMEGVLCYMLFAGSCHMRLRDFKKNAKIVTLLAIMTTFLGAVFYGLIFYGASQLLGLSLSLPVCLMFGSITAPTDPIAATSILKKFNLPKQIGFLIEGESLLNDGVGVALFVCFSGMVTAEAGGGLITVMVKELLGAVIVGLILTAIFFPIFSHSKDESRQIFTSLLTVTAAYLLSDYFGFSGAIASVVCGILFSALRNYLEEQGKTLELEKYDSFWEILDSLLNSSLYVMIGLTFVHILSMEHVLIISAVAIISNLIGRSGSLAVTTLFTGPLPDGYNKSSFIKLLTWGGLRGGLSIALAMSTLTMLPANTYHLILGGTYAIVFFTTIIQGLTMNKVYKQIEVNVNEYNRKK